MTDIIEAETVKAPTTADFYVVMIRYGDDYWSAYSTHRLLDEARKHGNACPTAGGEEWRIVLVRGLPIEVRNGQV